jgi:pantoate kinase
LSNLKSVRVSRTVYVPCGVSSFFEICDRAPDGSLLTDAYRIGARGGGFIIARGSKTIAKISPERDTVQINGRLANEAKTSFKVIELMRARFRFGALAIEHEIEPPIGSGFGTSGSGAIGAAIAISDLFGLKLTLSQAAAFAHEAEIRSFTGLGTVISLVSGAGGFGVVSEPGSYGVGRVDAILDDYSRYSLVCATFGPIEKTFVLGDELRRTLVNNYGRETLSAILKDPSAKSLLDFSREFATKTKLASEELLDLSRKAISRGAIGATQNMIGNAIHCLVPKSEESPFTEWLEREVQRTRVFSSPLFHGGPKIMS